MPEVNLGFNMMDSKVGNIYKCRKSVRLNTCSNGPQESLRTEIFLWCICGNKQYKHERRARKRKGKANTKQNKSKKSEVMQSKK